VHVCNLFNKQGQRNIKISISTFIIAQKVSDGSVKQVLGDLRKKVIYVPQGYCAKFINATQSYEFDGLYRVFGYDGSWCNLGF